jgi:NAD(P)-dependent dehydrogenase (short-subunit alcohol dehydrogenase family)
MKLQEKAVIITGGASGMGAASAALFAREGARLTLVGRSESGERVAADLRASGGEVQYVRGDVSRASDIEHVFRAHMQRFGRLDVLFNNAAYEGPGTSLTETSEDELDKVLATNIKGVYLACRDAAIIMKAAGSGVIINTSAASAREGLAWPNLSAYIASKGGVIALTRALAVELAPQIRVNSINPGLVDTPMLRGFTQKQSDPAAFHSALTQIQLLKRVGRAEEVARAALFLASDDSSYVTGTDLLVDGGLVLG